ncbi:hypothetical protein [Legionella saoudiensis]|uniref:hypothetical protein n=1 Tax=Legionella saoudiensis TaxID=1750561 RepID=UPI00072FD7AE|nr:hypothetical protein [Legionella saoudiensis]
MRIHWFFKEKEVDSIKNIIDKLGTDLTLLVNFYEQTLKQHPSVMPGIYKAPDILIKIMHRIHVVFNEQQEFKEAIDQENKLWCKPWEKYPSYNSLKAYLDFLKSIISPSTDILLTTDDESDDEANLMNLNA